MTKLLVVEDDPAIRSVVVDYLREQAYEVTVATTGVEAWEDFHNETYDCLLIDWMLPELDGLALTERIRKKSEVPILMLSAKSLDTDKVESLYGGVDDYLTKPFSVLELKARIDVLIRRSNRKLKNSEEPSEWNDGLRINWQRNEVYVHEQSIDLTQLEYALLALFLKNPEELFTKEQLYTLVWKQEGGVDVHTVTVHIKSLRQKLKDSPKTPKWIETVWGKGYRFTGIQL